MIIVSPMQGERLVAGPELMFVRVEATDDESGVADVWLQIDGEVMEQLHDDDRPYAIPIDLPVGPHRVRAYADDYEGRVGDSEPVMFEIVAPDSTDDDDGVVGRGCASDPRGRRAAWLWSLVFAARRRRLGDPS